ncbi:lysin [Lactobacillus sp. PV037]|uniref:SLAP domain-containing protein n=1 Tax=unclassified Lactobacillus TaxID=2620435 RepID=UPI00223F26E8|nr:MULTISPECIES: SLAP domain-containing protein [unclassified Lactobacillus]QNQ81744.1 lysin [Lactobacillus sp. PV012]QNQ84211.1 lysin [Lactobacillus sp. PV037]
MRSANKKFLSALACAGMMATTAVVGVGNIVTSKTTTVQAAKSSVSSRSYGVDVSSFQSTDLSKHANAGSQFAIVKVSEGTSYRNPNAAGQIASAKSTNMMPMAYHFATFGANSSAAVSEANWAVKSAQATGLPKGSYIACDWETGDGNVVTAGKDASANAIVAFMNKVKAAGYKPLLYSGAYLLKSNINTATVLNSYPNSLWVASYATMGRIDNPDFNYFPSMDGVAIWQFTDNWRGLYVDGNISLLPLSYNDASTQAPTQSKPATSSSASSKPATSSSSTKPASTTTTTNTVVTTPKTIMYKSVIYTEKGESTGKFYSAYTPIKVIGGVVNINNKAYYKIGDNQYVRVSNVDGVSKNLSHNAYVYNSKGHKTSAPTIKKGSALKVYGRSRVINGKSYYRVGKGQYVKVANFK